MSQSDDIKEITEADEIQEQSQTVEPVTRASTAAENPYVGPKPFETDEKDLFFGRDWEAAELIALIVAHPAVLFYAQSGAGKSSLLNAKVLPDLETQEDCEILPVARVRGDLPPEIKPEQIDNLYVFNALASWSEISDVTPDQMINLTLADFLRQLPRRGDNEGYPVLRVIVFDQFEELFNFYPERWPEREQFFRQVSEALAADDFLRVLFVIREEYLAQIDTYADLLPEMLRPRFRLERLEGKAALAAVKGPLKETHRTFAPGVAQALVAELLKIRVEGVGGKMIEQRGRFVEPVQLQVVCQSLWAALPPEVSQITADNLEKFGDVDQALTQFYERAITDTVQKLGGVSVLAEWRLRNWFEDELVTPAGTRGLVYRGSRKTGTVINAAVDTLEEHHIIRGERRAGARWYELTHDRFIGPIQKSNRAWRIATLRYLLQVVGSTFVGLFLILMAGMAIFNIYVPSVITNSELVDALQRAEATATVAAVQAADAEATATVAAVQAAEAEAKADVANAIAQEALEQAEAGLSPDATPVVSAKDRIRPLRAGVSIGGEDATAGTLGYFAVDGRGRLYLMSDANVLGQMIGAQILQPGPFDGGQIPEDVVGTLSTTPDPRRGEQSMGNFVALARLDPAIEIDSRVPTVGPILGVQEPQVEMRVRKLGRATGWTSGQITAVDQTVPLEVAVDGGVRRFMMADAAIADLNATPGDSGALVVDEAGYAVGLVVGVVSKERVVIAPMTEILNFFDVSLIKPELQIVDVAATLPGNEDKDFPERDPATIQRIILHHTVTPAGVSVGRIARSLVERRDLPGITYHYCVTEQGDILQTQPLDVAPGQTPGVSLESIDICLIGDFTDSAPPLAQLNTAAALIAQLAAEFDIPLSEVYGRNDLESTNASPGATWPAWRESLLAAVQELAGQEVELRVATPTPTPTPLPTLESPGDE